jgi:hypothetical protein
VAAIASSRIASGGVYHKPRADDANAANGTDASSPFQQMLSTTAAAAAPAAHDQGASDHSDSGKKSGKDSKNDAKADGKAGQSKATQSQNNAALTAADSKTLIQAGAANDDGQADTRATPGSDSTVTGKDTNGKDTDTAGQTNASPAQQPVPDDAGQTLAAQLPVPTAQDAKAGTDASDNTDASAALPDSNVTKDAAAAQIAPTKDDAATSSAFATDMSSSTSKPGKAKHGGQDPVTAQVQGKDANAEADSTTPSPAPVAKKDHRSAKTGHQDSSTAANAQTTQPDAMVAMAAVSAAPLPTASAATSDADSDSSNAIAAAGTGRAKSGQAKSSSNANPPPGVKSAAPGSQASAGAPASSSNGAPSPTSDASAASQGGSQIQSGDPSQSTDSKPTDNSKDDKQAASAPVQAQAQTPASQPQPQVQAAIVPAAQLQQLHTGATDSVTQNIQISPGDANSNANTVGALAVAIAAKSQSGNKQFDIRLDPPELGRVEVRLSIDATGKVQASLSADQPRTLDLLKTDAPTLTRALRDAGLNVSQNGLNFSLRGQDRQNSGNSFTPRTGRPSQSLIATSVIGSVPSGANYQGPANGRLDIRV